jgi:hypothetical protein
MARRRSRGPKVPGKRTRPGKSAAAKAARAPDAAAVRTQPTAPARKAVLAAVPREVDPPAPAPETPQAERGTETPRARSDRFRRWAFPAALLAVAVGALVIGRPWAPAEEESPASPPEGVATYEGETVRLTLEAGSAQPPENVRAELWIEGETEPIARHDGALPIDLRAPRGRALMLLVEAPGRVRFAERITLSRERTIRIPLGEGAALRGVAVDERGAPIEGASILLRRDDGPASPWTAGTDETGSFDIDTLMPGTYRLEAIARGYARAVRNGVDPGERIRLVLERVGLVAGRVVRPDGSGADRATVVIAGSGLWPARQVQAGENGRFRLEAIPPGIYEVRAHEGDLVAEPRRGLTVEPGQPAFLTFSLSPGVPLSGIVRDSISADPIEGAEITVSAEALDASPRAVTSGADGRFAVRGLQSGPHRVSAFAEGYVPVASIEWEPGRPLELDLEPAASISGVVLDERRQPIEGATIEVLGESDENQPVALGPGSSFRESVFAAQLAPAELPPLEVVAGPVPPIPITPFVEGLVPSAPAPAEVRISASFLSDAEGRFHVAGIPPGHVQVVARRSGRAPGSTARIYVTAGVERDDVELVLPPAGSLRGTVRDERGEGVEAVLVEVRSDRDPNPRVAVTDDRGEFSLDDVFGELTITALPQGRPAVRASVSVASGREAVIELRLEGELHALHGRVLDAAGFPISSAQVRVFSLRADAPFQRTLFSDGDGTFVAPNLPAPPWRLEASDPAYAPGSLDVISSEREISIVLRAGARVSGSLLDDSTGEPLHAGRVILTRDSFPPEQIETRSGAAGDFLFARVRSGSWTLRASTPDHREIEHRFEVTERSREPVDVELDALRLTATGWLEGTVVDALGAPIARARISLADVESGPVAETDPQGNFVLRGVVEGTVEVLARHPAAGEGRSRTTRVFAGQGTPGVLVHLSERFDPERAQSLPGRRRGVALIATGSREVRVSRVVPGSSAERSGLREGDVLLEIDGTVPTSASHAARLLAGAVGVPAIVRAQRGEETATLVIDRESWLPPVD